MEPGLLIALAIVLAWMLDLFFGDPFGMLHPVVGYGWLISKGEKRFNKGEYRFIKGLFLVVSLIITCFLLFWFLFRFLREYNFYFYIAASVVFVFFGLANRTLISEGKMVFQALKENGIEGGRKQVARIVGRDTSELNEQQIKTAVLETLSENLSDGVVAPMFWLAIGGVPAMMAYKMINTIDSMLGYKSERYFKFGKAGAIIDDIANWIPARLTAAIMLLLQPKKQVIQHIRLYARSHASPNAGYPESALAGILGVQFGGPNIYYGKLIEKPFIGENAREINENDLKISIRVNHLVCLLMVLIAAFVQWQIF